MGSLFFLSLVLLQAVGLAVAEESTERFEEVAQRLVKAINTQDYTGIENDFSKAVLDDDSLEKLKQITTVLKDQFGKIEKFGPPKVTGPNRAVFAAHCVRRDFDITIVLDDHNKIIGLSIRPHKEEAIKSH